MRSPYQCALFVCAPHNKRAIPAADWQGSLPHPCLRANQCRNAWFRFAARPFYHNLERRYQIFFALSMVLRKARHIVNPHYLLPNWFLCWHSFYMIMIGCFATDPLIVSFPYQSMKRAYQKERNLSRIFIIILCTVILCTVIPYQSMKQAYQKEQRVSTFDRVNRQLHVGIEIDEHSRWNPPFAGESVTYTF